MRTHPSSALALAALLAFACGGCGPSVGDKLPDLIPVKGKVTYKGKPLAKGTVRFEPDGYGRMASGKLNADGTFVLTTLKDGDGVVPGHHRVSVSETGPGARKELIPSKYVGPNTSGLEAEVDAQHTEFTFDIP